MARLVVQRQELAGAPRVEAARRRLAQEDGLPPGPAQGRLPGAGPPNGVLPLETWWQNKGVAPCYEDFALALRLVGELWTLVRLTDARIPSWLPGDALYDGRVFLPRDMPEGAYELQLGIVDRQTREPRVRLAIEGRTPDGWYRMGPITVEEGPYPVTTERVLEHPVGRESACAEALPWTNISMEVRSFPC